ncbi:MAG: helix-turn-helix domain-containing protein [Myxococcota bacterium]
MAILQLPGGLRSAFALSLDVLDVANRVASGLGSPEPFKTHVLRVGDSLDAHVHAVVLPGMGCSRWSEVQTILGSPAGRWAVQLMKQARREQRLLATSCAGVFVAAEAGALDGGGATTSWFLEHALAEHYPAIDLRGECMLIESQGCITGGAAMAHADVMLALVERHAGEAVADLCASYLLLDRRQSQRPYRVLTALLQGDRQLLAAGDWVRKHVAKKFTVEEVAHAAGLGARTFARRLKRVSGLSPIQFVQRIRMDHAKALIRAGASYESAAEHVGYSDGSALRRMFRKRGAA